MSATNGVTLGYINDGQTRSGYVQAVPRLYPAVRFKFRPVLARDRAVIVGRVSRGDDTEAEKVAAWLLATNIVEWDLRMGDGQTVPLETRHTKRLQPMLLQKLYLIVLGAVASDEDPEEVEESFDELNAFERDMEAALKGEDVPTQEERREGNSEAGCG